ncbi:MAG: hypothetical protein MJ202_06535 [Lentisphaeria bacterium]|nr:hypothetical protein [Lentisphaeria bacterium]
MKKTFAFLFSFVFLLVSITFAQEEEQPSVADTNPSGGEQVVAEVAQYSANAKTQLEAIAKKAKLKKASRKGKATYSIQIASVGCKPDSKDYATNRQSAFDRAFLAAKSEIARNLAAQVKTSAELAMQTGKLAEGQSAANDKVQNMVNAAVFEMLVEQGVDLEDEAAVMAALPKVLNSTEFKQMTETAAVAYMIGVQAFAVVADNNSIGVLATYSDVTRDMAVAMFSGEKVKFNGPRVEDLNDMLDEIDANVLANTFGLRAFIEDDGEEEQFAMVSFVQVHQESDSASSEAIANAKARTIAEGQYREFAGQNVAVVAALEQSQNITELADNLGELSAVDQNFSQKCQARGDKLQISGINPLDSKTVVLPSGHKVLCSSFVWTPESSQYAMVSVEKNRQAEKIVNQGPKIKEAIPVEAPAKKTTAPAKPVHRPNIYQNKGTSGSGLGGGVF